jgi:hypothetical protein
VSVTSAQTYIDVGQFLHGFNFSPRTQNLLNLRIMKTTKLQKINMNSPGPGLPDFPWLINQP